MTRNLRSRPPPAHPWLMAQRWHEVLFAHWPVGADELAEQIPSGMTLDTYAGSGWIGVVPFRMSGIRLRRSPAVPRFSAFLELNVRTYVTVDDKPGVYFFSLDAASRPAVWIARRRYRLPYFHARMQATREGDLVTYRSERLTGPARFAGSYGPAGPELQLEHDSLDRWLTERYCLYTTDRYGRVLRQEIDHAVWPIQPASATITLNTMAAAAGVTLPDTPPLLHYAEQMDVLIWPQERCR